MDEQPKRGDVVLVREAYFDRPEWLNCVAVCVGRTMVGWRFNIIAGKPPYWDVDYFVRTEILADEFELVGHAAV